MTYLLQDDDGQIAEAHSISAGLDYPGIGPEHSWLHDTKRAQYVSITDDEALEGFELLVVPTMGTVAPPRSAPEAELRRPVLRFTEPFNVLGWPALALPCGPAEAGLPASISLVARAGEDALVLGAGLAYAGTAANPRTASS